MKLPNPGELAIVVKTEVACDEYHLDTSLYFSKPYKGSPLGRELEVKAWGDSCKCCVIVTAPWIKQPKEGHWVTKRSNLMKISPDTKVKPSVRKMKKQSQS
jgi:hypothetical protein